MEEDDDDDDNDNDYKIVHFFVPSSLNTFV